MEEPQVHDDRSGREPSARSFVVGLVGVEYWLSPILLAATTCGVLLVLRGPDRWFGYAAATLLGIAVAWILVSVLHPARADRSCPQCKRPALERADPTRTLGVLCSACGRYDPQESSFLMAEEEGVIDTVVLHERGERARARLRAADRAQSRLS